MFVDELDKYFADVGLYILTVGWIEPDFVSIIDIEHSAHRCYYYKHEYYVIYGSFAYLHGCPNTLNSHNSCIYWHIKPKLSEILENGVFYMMQKLSQ